MNFTESAHRAAMSIAQRLPAVGRAARFARTRALLFSLVIASTAVQAQTAAPVPAAPASAASAPESTGAPSQRIEVSGRVAAPYTIKEASSGTRTDTPIMETPMSIQVVPKQVLQEQRIHSISDAVKNVSGITRGGNYGVGDTYGIRGFQHGDATYEDGARMSNGAAVALPRNLANIEQVEVIKGPASILYGQGEPGGLVNNVTKKPLDHDYYALEQEIGSFRRFSTLADLSGPLNVDGTLLYRLNVATETERSFRDFVDTKRFDIYPTFQWKLSPQTQVTTQLHYGKGYGYVGDSGIPLLNGKRADIPIARNLGEPGFNRNDVEERSIKVGWSHEFNDRWMVRNYFKLEDISSCKNGLNQIFALDVPDINGDMPRGFAALFYNGTQTWNASLDLTGKFETLGVKHTFLTGVDFYRLNEFFAGGSDVVNVPSINIFSPVYNQPHPPFDRANDFMVDHTAQAYGVFIQDQLELPNHLFLLLGLRHDRASDHSNLDPNAANPYPVFDYPKFRDKPPLSHRYGLLWRPVSELSVYASYTENFGASAFGQIQFDGGRSPGETAQQYELGVKAELLDKRLTGSMSVYQLTKQNVLATDPVHGAPYVIPLGEVRSRGFEMDVTGEVAPRWSLVMSYSYIDSQTTKADPVELIGRTAGVAHHSGSLWTTYAFNGTLAGVKVGGGVEAASSQIDYFKNRLSGYAMSSLYASYSWRTAGKRLVAQLNVNNVFNKTYYASTDNIPGKPRWALATLRVEL